MLVSERLGGKLSDLGGRFPCPTPPLQMNSSLYTLATPTLIPRKTNERAKSQRGEDGREGVETWSFKISKQAEEVGHALLYHLQSLMHVAHLESYACGTLQ